MDEIDKYILEYIDNIMSNIQRYPPSPPKPPRKRRKSPVPVLGCTNPAASNYNSSATQDDGSCIILGCTNPAASNYNSSATQDDGSCVLSPTIIDFLDLNPQIVTIPNPYQQITWASGAAGVEITDGRSAPGLTNLKNVTGKPFIAYMKNNGSQFQSTKKFNMLSIHACPGNYNNVTFSFKGYNQLNEITSSSTQVLNGTQPRIINLNFENIYKLSANVVTAAQGGTTPTIMSGVISHPSRPPAVHLGITNLVIRWDAYE